MRFISIGLCFLLGVFAYGQECSYTLSGTISDFHNNAPLIGATVILVGPEKAILTDLHGHFKIEGVCKGTYRLQISHPACLTKVIKVSLEGNTVKNIHLEHHVDQLERVVITGNSNQDAMQTAEETYLSDKMLAKNSAASLGQLLKNVTGVNSLNTGNHISKPVIQGLSGSRVLIMNHSTRLQGQEWGSEHAPEIDINSAGSISVIKGASALQYGGDAIGGVIKINPKRIPRKDSLYGHSVLVGATNGRGVGLTSSLTKSFASGWFISAQGTLKHFGDGEAPDYMLSNTGYREKAFSTHIGYDVYTEGLSLYYSFFQNEIGILSASHLGGIEDQLRALESSQPLIIHDFSYAIDAPRQEVNHHLGKLAYFKRFKNAGKWTVQYDFQRNHRMEFDRRRNSAENNVPAVDLLLKTHSFSTDFDFNSIEDASLKIGVSALYQDNFSNPQTGVKRLIPDYKKYDFGAYAIGSYEVNKDFTGELGVRYDYSKIDAYKYYQTTFWKERGYQNNFSSWVVKDFGNQLLVHPVMQFNAFSATAGLAYKISDIGLKFNYSLANRAPNPSELFSEGLHHSAARIELGDLRFTNEVAHKFTLSIQKEKGAFQFHLNPYVQFIDNFVVLDPVGIRQTIRGSYQVWAYRQTQAELMGLNLDLAYQLTKNIGLRHQFSLVKGKDKSKKIALAYIPPVRTQTKVHYDNPEWHNFSFSVESVHVFAQNEYPDLRFEVFVPTTQTTETVDLSTPPGAYHLWNLSTGIDVLNNAHTQMRVGLKVTNLFDKSYRDYMNRQRYYADNLGRNIQLRLVFNY